MAILRDFEDIKGSGRMLFKAFLGKEDGWRIYNLSHQDFIRMLTEGKAIINNFPEKELEKHKKDWR